MYNTLKQNLVAAINKAAEVSSIEQLEELLELHAALNTQLSWSGRLNFVQVKICKNLLDELLQAIEAIEAIGLIEDGQRNAAFTKNYKRKNASEEIEPPFDDNLLKQKSAKARQVFSEVIEQEGHAIIASKILRATDVITLLAGTCFKETGAEIKFMNVLNHKGIAVSENNILLILEKINKLDEAISQRDAKSRGASSAPKKIPKNLKDALRQLNEILSDIDFAKTLTAVQPQADLSKLYLSRSSGIAKLDDLAILLNPSENPCTALFINEGQLIIACNSQKKDTRIIDDYKVKIASLLERVKMLKDEALFADQEFDKMDVNQRFCKSYKEGRYKEIGIDLEQILTNFQIIYTLTTSGLDVHAEQLLHRFLLSKKIDIKGKPLGCSKLCCYDCARVLMVNKEHAPKIRGTHGVSFPCTARIKAADKTASEVVTVHMYSSSNSSLSEIELPCGLTYIRISPFFRKRAEMSFEKNFLTASPYTSQSSDEETAGLAEMTELIEGLDPFASMSEQLESNPLFSESKVGGLIQKVVPQSQSLSMDAFFNFNEPESQSGDFSLEEKGVLHVCRP